MALIAPQIQQLKNNEEQEFKKYFLQSQQQIKQMELLKKSRQSQDSKISASDSQTWNEQEVRDLDQQVQLQEVEVD